MKATRTPGTIAPHSWPYWPLIPQPIPPAAAHITGAATNKIKDEEVSGALILSLFFKLNLIIYRHIS